MHRAFPSLLGAAMLLASFAASAETCGGILFRFDHSKYAEATRRLFTPEIAERLVESLRPRADAIFGDRTLSEAQKVEAVFNAYMEARQRDLPVEVREKLSRTLADLKVKYFEPRAFERDVSGGAREIFGILQLKLAFPKMLAGTVVDFATRVHELEHVIQIYSHGMGAAGQYLFPHFVVDLHAVEEGAMRSEGSFLSLFPLARIESERNRLAKHSAFAGKMLTRALRATSIQEYLQLNWDDGRYTVAQIRMHRWLNVAIFPFGIIPVVWLSYIFGF